ncbi:hypothetical protein O3G_MSEX013998 [Manduca sexta]|uniref:Uncharacterized protein n=2 Tax=Manduca sexta TaxID=7130 RepID=A0A922CYY7_MANSE|nr:hypothetical protein O3G_MSEX013998 [Manduca sexta]
MMLEYDDDFFFEEDKIKSTDDLSHNALLTQIDENATITFEEALKQVDEIQIFEE